MVNIEKLRMTKPSWATDPETLDFKVVNEPLEKLVKRTINTLERMAREQFSEFDFLAEKILSGCYQTYKAIRKLVAKDSKYPTQAHILNRSILDSLFVIEAFSEDPGKYPRAYALAGYRMIWEEYTKETQKYGNDPNWDEYLADKVKLLEFSAKIYNLSEDERKSPKKNIPYWPIPSKMLRDRIFSKKKHLFLKELYDWHYGWESALSHFQWGGMSATVFSSLPEHHWHPGKFESDAVYKSILYLLMIISEIEAVSEIGIKQDTKYIWTIVGSYWEEAKEFYDKRFSNLLKD
ncbi:MAG: DUF5677 domain-containing protein [Planctomycetota bacterium]|jgi:hypothetical protein